MPRPARAATTRAGIPAEAWSYPDPSGAAGTGAAAGSSVSWGARRSGRSAAAGWSVDLADRQSVRYQQVEPTVVVEVDNAVDGALAKARHRVRRLWVRADLTPEDVPPVGTR